MNTKNILLLLLTAAVVAPISGLAKEKKGVWKDNLTPVEEKLSNTGRNTYFILEPGYQLVLEGEDGGKKAELTITVLDETKKIGDIETRVVEEKEVVGGNVVEISRNYFAIGTLTKNVYYFGEDVDVYKRNGKIVHEGSWHAGEGDAQHGILIPGQPKVGGRYYQERAPKVALDRGENVSISENVRTPAGDFKNCLKVKESTPLEPGTEYKVYAPEVGLIQDAELKLVKFGFIKKQAKSINPPGQTRESQRNMLAKASQGSTQ